MPDAFGVIFTTIVITACAVILAMAIAIYSWVHRKVTGAISMMLMALLGVIWGSTYLIEIFSRDIELKNIWDSVQLLPASFLAPTFLIFSMEFSGKKNVSSNPRWLLTYLIPAATIFIIPTNQQHHLLKAALDLQTDTVGWLEPLFPTYRVWFWIVIIYSFLLLSVSLLYLFKAYRQAPRWARNRIGIIIFAEAFPVLGGMVSIPLWAKHMGPNIMLISLVAFLFLLTWGIFNNRMLEVVPLARSTLISQMSDAVITLDPHGLILDCNTAAANIKQLQLTDHIGESFPILLNKNLKTYLPFEDCLDQSMEVALGNGSDARIYDMSISPLMTSTKEVAGSLVVMREVTKKKQEDIERVLIEERYHAIFDNSIYSILLLNQQGMIIENNPEAANLSGYSRDQLLFRSLDDIIQEAPDLPRNETRKTSTVQEAKLIHASGDFIPVEISVIPIVKGDESIYYVTIQDIRERKQAENITRSALENVQSRIDELAILRSVTESLNQASSLRTAILPVLETVTAITKSRHVWLFLLGKSDRSYQRIEYHPLDEDNLLVVDNLHGSYPSCLQKLIEGRVENPRTIKVCNCNTQISTTHFSLPLYIGKQPLGLLNFIEEGGVQLNENKVRLLHTVCDSLAVAIERVRLFKSEHDQRKLAETMRDIGTTLTTSLDMNEILDLLLDQLSRLVPYDGGNVALVDGPITRIERFRGYELVGKKKASTLMSRPREIEKTENLRMIINSRKPLIIPDTSKDKNWVPDEVSIRYHAWLGVPVIIDGKVEVIFCLDKVEPGFYTQEHARLVSLFATQSSLAIKNSHLYTTEVKRIKELDSLRATLTDISSQLDVNTLLKEIAKRAIYLLNAQMGEIGLYEADKDALRVVVSENLKKDTVGKLLKTGEGVMGKVLENKQPLVITNYQNDTGRADEYEESGPFIGLAVPMLAGNNDLLGVIGVGDNEMNRIFTENDIRLLNLFAQQATIALRNAQLFTDAKRRAEEAETLRKAGAVVVSSLNRDEALRLILEQLAHVVPYDSASVLLQKQNVLQIVGGHGFKDANPVLGLEIPLDRKNPGACVFLDNKPRLIANTLNEAPNFNHITENHYIIRSWLGVPLTIHNQAIGILSLDAHNPEQFTEEHARLVTAFADQVAIALENSRLYENAVQSAIRNETLYKLSQAISANIRSEEIYPAIYEATTELMETEFFCIAVVNEKNQTIEDVFITDRKESVELSSRPLGQGLFGKALAEGRSLLYNTFDESMIASTGAIVTGNMDSDEISQSVLIVPLRIGSKLIGVLSAQSYKKYAYTESDLEMLELLGANAAIALENARLFSEVQELAITDPVTNLYNRRKFLELAEQELNRSIRYGRDLSAIMVDIDHFKLVNDTFGHTIGDQLLIHLAEVSKSCIRQVDILARYGGEEFIVLLPETNAAEAAVIAERLRATTEATSTKTVAGQLSITVSLGVAEIDKDCTSLPDLIDRADFAQYASKDAGRNRVTLWNPNIVQRSKDTGSLHADKSIMPD